MINLFINIKKILLSFYKSYLIILLYIFIIFQFKYNFKIYINYKYI